MAIEVTCPDVEVPELDATIRLPGGVTIAAVATETIPSQLQVAKQLVASAGTALAPLAPFFTLLDAVLGVKSVLDAIPGSLGPPPDPTAIVQALGNLAPKINRLLSIIPQLSVPLLAIDLIDAVIATLNGVIEQLEAVAVQEAKIAAAAVLAAQPGNAALSATVECATELNVSVKAAISSGLGPLNSVIGVLNVLLGLIPGGVTVPDLTSLPEDTAEAIASLEAVTSLLTQIRGTIPAP